MTAKRKVEVLATRVSLTERRLIEAAAADSNTTKSEFICAAAVAVARIMLAPDVPRADSPPSGR